MSNPTTNLDLQPTTPKMPSSAWFCIRCKAAMPPAWPKTHTCPSCYPKTIWEVYHAANPLRVKQEGHLYFKYDYSCISCRKHRPASDIVWVIRRYLVEASKDFMVSPLDPEPPLWTCKDCYPAQDGMWVKKRVLTPPPPSSIATATGEEKQIEDAYRPRDMPNWLMRVDSNFALPDEMPPGSVGKGSTFPTSQRKHVQIPLPSFSHNVFPPSISRKPVDQALPNEYPPGSDGRNSTFPTSQQKRDLDAMVAQIPPPSFSHNPPVPSISRKPVGRGPY